MIAFRQYSVPYLISWILLLCVQVCSVYVLRSVGGAVQSCRCLQFSPSLFVLFPHQPGCEVLWHPMCCLVKHPVCLVWEEHIVAQWLCLWSWGYYTFRDVSVCVWIAEWFWCLNCPQLFILSWSCGGNNMLFVCTHVCLLCLSVCVFHNVFKRSVLGVSSAKRTWQLI